MRQFTKVLIFIMSVMLLLSVPLSAADPIQEGYGGVSFDGDIYLKKEFIPDPAATESNLFGKLRLESFVTGSTSSSNIPVDVVLVLDQSGSMDEVFTTEDTGTYTPLPDYSWSNWASNLYDYNTGNYAGTLRVLIDNVYYEVETLRYWNGYYYRYYIYYTWNNGSSYQYLPNGFGAYYDTEIPGDFYTFSGTSVTYTRLDALKNAVTNFTNAIQTHANGPDGVMGGGDDLNHRVAIVGYSSFASRSGTYYYNTELLTGVPVQNNNGVQFDYTGVSMTNPYPVGAGLTGATALESALVSMDTIAGRNSVTTAINALDAEGGTRTDRGMLMAKQILDANPVGANEVRAQVVIVFTDGAPTYSSNFALQVADNALGYAKAIKDKGIPVYSVGIFPGASCTTGVLPLTNVTNDPNEGMVIKAYDNNGNPINTTPIINASNRFMHYISSNYPDATLIANTYTRAANSEYYLAAQSAAQLNSVFTKIARETLYHLGNKDLNEHSTVLDIVSEFCDIPTGTLASQVKLYTAKLTGVNAGKLAANPLDDTAYIFAPEAEWSEWNAGTPSALSEGTVATFTRPSSSESINLKVRFNVAPYTSVNGNPVMLDYVKAEGYNYNTHYCGLNIDGGTSVPNPAGEKLIIEFPIEFNYNSPVEYLSSDTFDTNAFGSGVYPTDPDADDNGAYDGGITPAGLFEFPYGKYYIVYTYTMNNDGTYTSVEKVVKAVAKDATFANIDLTQSVPENYIYGGYWTHDTAPQADNQDTNPLNISGTEAGKWVTERFTRDVAGTSVAPVTGNSYNVRCVPDTYLRPGYHITYAEATASQNPLLPHNLYVTTGVDCTAYKYVGFDMRRDDVSSSPRASIVYNVLSGIDTLGSPKNYSIADMFYFEDGSGERLIGSLGVAMITPPDGSCASDAASLTWWDNFKNCIYTPFWVTPDNVKVNGVKERTIDWKTEFELAGKQLDKTDKTDLTFSLRGKFPSVCALDTYNPDNLAAAPVMLTLWDSFALDAPFNGPTEGSENISSGTTGENANTTPAQSYDFSYKLVHSLINRMGQRVIYNTYISTDDSDFVEIGVIVNGRTYSASRVGQAPRLANLKYNYVAGWMGYGISTVQAYKVMADGTVVYGDTVSVK